MHHFKRRNFSKALFGFWISALASVLAQPANDHFANAQQITITAPLPLTITGDTTGATVEAEETMLDSTLAASVWYKVTAPGNGVVQVDTEGSDFPTRLVIAVGNSYPSLTLITADDEPANGTAVVFEVQASVEYHIAVFGVSGATGNLSLNLRETTDASISGHVTTLTGASPLGQITVQALIYNAVIGNWIPAAQTMTNELGGYTLANLPIGPAYRVRAADPSGNHAPLCHGGARFVDDATSVTPDVDLFDIDVALPSASITGAVQDGSSSGIGGITARAFAYNTTAAKWQEYATTTSASNGSFIFLGLPTGSYRLEFEDDSQHQYLPSFYNGSANIDTAQDITITSEGQNLSGHTVALQTGGSIQGTVTHRITGLPIPGIRIQPMVFNVGQDDWEMVPQRGISESDGSYIITGLPYDTYGVVFADFEAGALAPSTLGGGINLDIAPLVVLTSGTPAVTGIDHAVEPVRITSLAPTSGGDFTLSFLGTPYAQFTLETSPNLSNWSASGLPVNHTFGTTETTVTPENTVTSQFWRMRGPHHFTLSPITNVHQRTSYAITQQSYRWTNRYQYITGGFLSAFAFGDFNNDGKTDVLTFPGIFLSHTSFPAQLTLDIDDTAANGDAVFEGGVPGAIHPRKLLVGDLNGDNVDDAVLIDHGYDASPYPGAPLQVLLSAPGGKIETTLYNEHTGFHHAGALGDIDHDGDLDLFLASPKALGDINLILINDGQGRFTPSNQLVGEMWEKNIWASEFFDLDGDGFLDLAIGGSVTSDSTTSDPAAILWGSSSGTYGSATLPLTNLPSGWEVYDYDAEDFDGDGDRDLLITLANLTTDDHQFRLLINEGGRSFVDHTHSHFADPTYAGHWLDFVFVQDVDSDGDLDIVADITGTLLKWENDGAGHYTLITAP